MGPKLREVFPVSAGDGGKVGGPFRVGTKGEFIHKAED